MIRSVTDSGIHALCREYGTRLALRPGEPHGAAVLYALFLTERYNGANAVPRFEPAYGPGGRYFRADLYRRWGEDAAKSYSNWQIMFTVAVELGYTGSPEMLDDDGVAIRYVVRLLNNRLIPLARKDDQVVTLDELLDAYNSGNPRDTLIPTSYIRRGRAHYQLALDMLALRPAGEEGAFHGQPA